MIVLLMALVLTPVRADDPSKMSKGTQLEIRKYICGADIYQVVDLKHPDEGPFYSKRGAMINAVDVLKSKGSRLMKAPDSVLEEIYKLDRDLPILTFAEGINQKLKWEGKKCPPPQLQISK